MIFTSSQKLQAFTDGAATTTEPTFCVDYVDIETSNFGVSDLGSSVGSLTGATAADILSSPASGRRHSIFASVTNEDTVAHTVTVVFDNGGTDTILATTTLQAGQTLTWTKDEGWATGLDLLSLFDVDNTWNGLQTFLGGGIVGDPGVEASGITVGGTTYESVFKISDLGGTNVAQTILHRHSTTLPPILVGSRSHSDTSAHTIVSDGDGLLSIYGVGWDGVDYAIGAIISMVVDGTPGAGAMPTRIDFAVSPDGSETPAVAMSINPDGTVTFENTIDGLTAFRGALVDLASNYSLADATNTAIPWTSEVEDPENLHSNTVNNTRITVPTGVSRVRPVGTVTFASNSTGLRQIQFVLNGSSVEGIGTTSIGANASGTTTINISGYPISVSPGDYVECKAYQNSGGSLNIVSGTSTWFGLEIIE